MKKITTGLIIVLSGLFLSACSLKTPTKNTTTPTATVMPTTIPTEIPTNTPTIKLTPTKIPTPTIDANRACIEEDRYLTQIKDECGRIPFPGVDECITIRNKIVEVNCVDSDYLRASGMSEAECKESNLARVNKIKELKPLYLQAKTNCGL